MALVGYFLVGVVESAFSMHFVLHPVADIPSSFAVVKGSKSMSLSIELGTLVLPSRIFLAHSHELLLLLLAVSL